LIKIFSEYLKKILEKETEKFIT